MTIDLTFVKEYDSFRSSWDEGVFKALTAAMHLVSMSSALMSCMKSFDRLLRTIESSRFNFILLIILLSVFFTSNVCISSVLSSIVLISFPFSLKIFSFNTLILLIRVIVLVFTTFISSSNKDLSAFLQNLKVFFFLNH